MSIQGIDISHWQGKINWDKVKKFGVQFAIQKCTEGTTYKDPTYQFNKDEARKAGILFGSYHFARGKDANKEAEFFVNNVDDTKEGELLVLDWEIQLSNPVAWCLNFLTKVEQLTGIKPFLYINQSTLNYYNWEPCNSYGLWIARYGKEPVLKDWAFIAMHQYSSKGKVDGITGNVDLNTAFMSLETLKKYGKKEVVIPTTPDLFNQASMIYPIDKVYITQGFGENPNIYKQLGMKGHNGVDFRTKFIDSPLGHRYVQSVKGGVITELGNDGAGGYGLYVRVNHKGTEETLYAHLKKWYVKKGQMVKKGEVIALTDNTGFSTGSHLHFGWRPDKFNYGNGFKGYEPPKFENG